MFRSFVPYRAVATAATETPPNLIHRYEALVAEGVLKADSSQLRCLGRLQSLLEDLHSYGRKLRIWEGHQVAYENQRQQASIQIRRDLEATAEHRAADSKGLFSRFLEITGQNSNTDSEVEAIRQAARLNIAVEERLDAMLGPAPPSPPAPRGIYLHGTVGSGKTMLADMFYTAAAEDEVLPLRRRVHCNAAMLELHSRMHSIEAAEHAAIADSSRDFAKHAKLARIAQRRLARERLITPLEQFSNQIASSNASIMLRAARALLRGDHTPDALSAVGPSTSSAALLCFDEMQTTDPYNVAAIKALTEAALGDGGSLVATSNRAPRELTSHGLHEAMFEHFVDTLEAGCDIVNLSSDADYRKAHIPRPSSAKEDEEISLGNLALKSYFFPQSTKSTTEMEAAWEMLPGKDGDAPIEIPVMFGRTLPVLRHRGNAAWFSFDELCSRPLGPADYVALAAEFHTVFISDVPAMSMRSRDKARRFITLVDEVYNRRGRLVCSAAVSIDELFTGAGAEAKEEPLVDLEGIQFEGAVEGARLRRDLGSAGGVAPVAATAGRLAALGGEEEKFAFARAISRMYEMQSSKGAYQRLHMDLHSSTGAVYK